MMPTRTSIKTLLDSAINKAPANSVWKGYWAGQVGTAALRDVRDLDAHEVKSHDAASHGFGAKWNHDRVEQGLF